MLKSIARSITMQDVWKELSVGKVFQSIGSILFQSLNSTVKILAPLAISKTIEMVIKGEESFEIPIISAAVSEGELLYMAVSLNVLVYILPQVNRMITADIQEEFGRKYNKKLIEEVQKLPYETYLEKKDTMKNDFNLILGTYHEIATSFFHGTVPFILDYSFGTVLIWKLIGQEFGIGFLVYAPVNIMVTQLFRKLLSKYDPVQLSKDMDKAACNYMIDLHTGLDNPSLTRLAARGVYETENVIMNYKNFSDQRVKSIKYAAVWQISGMMPVLALNIMISVLINHGGFHASEIFKLIFLIQYSLLVLPTINDFNNKLSKAQQVTRRVDELKRKYFNTPNAIQQIAQLPQNNPINLNQPMMFGNGNIEFKNVTFGYLPNKPVLNNVSFTIDPGKKTAFVGPSGCGKSTAVKLLLRMYGLNNTLDGNIISYNGVNINDLNLNAFRNLFGVVPQNVEIFPKDTMRYNILYTSGDEQILRKFRYQNWEETAKNYLAENEDIADAFDSDAVLLELGDDDKNKVILAENKIQSAATTAEISLEDDALGRTANLSGGEKQRIGIARLIARNSQIFVFDEPTSALDSMTESNIVENINKISEEKTTIIVAHRLSTIKDADKIIVFKEDGTIDDQGTHGELIEREGDYAMYWQKQT